MPWTEHTIERNGVRLAYRDWGGDGRPPLLLLHGLAGHAGEWDALAALLTPTHRVIALDQRGHGASERFPADVTPDAYIADVVALITHVALGPVVLTGQSLGGHTAILTAARHPELVRALVPVEAAVGGPDPEWPAQISRWFNSWPPAFPSRDAAVEFFGGGAIGAGWADGLREQDGHWHPRFAPEVLLRSVESAAAHSHTHEWERVTCPTLLILAQSGFIPPPTVDNLLRRRPTTLSASVPGTSHDLHLEHPSALHDLITRFLTALPA